MLRTMTLITTRHFRRVQSCSSMIAMAVNTLVLMCPWTLSGKLDACSTKISSSCSGSVGGIKERATVEASGASKKRELQSQIAVEEEFAAAA